MTSDLDHVIHLTWTSDVERYYPRKEVALEISSRTTLSALLPGVYRPASTRFIHRRIVSVTSPPKYGITLHNVKMYERQNYDSAPGL
jgi:hypothetical protein